MKSYTILLALLACCLLTNAQGQSRVLKYQIVNQYANDMVYDSVRGQILISIPSKDTAHGNSIGYFSPDSVRLISSFFIGSEPRPIALTFNSKYLYVGVDGSASIKKFDLDSTTTVQTFTPGALSFSGPRLARNLSCHPNNDSTVAVSLMVTGSSPSGVGVAIFRNGVKLHDTIGSYPDLINNVHYRDSTNLYACDNESSGAEFYRLSASGSGVQKLNKAGSLFDGSSDFYIVGNLAYTDNGTVIDLSTTVPSLYATFNLSTTWGFFGGKACYDKAEDLWCFAGKGFWTDSVYIQRFRASNFLLKDVITVGKVTSDVNKMIYWGDSSRYAISTKGGQLIVTSGFKTVILPSEVLPAINGKDQISIYPNPATDVVHINHNTDVSIALYDALGALVLKQADVRSISLKQLPAGLYTLHVLDGKGTVLSIQHVTKL